MSSANAFKKDKARILSSCWGLNPIALVHGPCRCNVANSFLLLSYSQECGVFYVPQRDDRDIFEQHKKHVSMPALQSKSTVYDPLFIP